MEVLIENKILKGVFSGGIETNCCGIELVFAFCFYNFFHKMMVVNLRLVGLFMTAISQLEQVTLMMLNF